MFNWRRAGVEFPDFPGCVTAAKIWRKLGLLLRRPLRFHIEGMLEDGELLPRPSRFEKLMSDPANRKTVALLVDVSEGRTRKSA